jgi:hypothetical protein
MQSYKCYQIEIKIFLNCLDYDVVVKLYFDSYFNAIMFFENSFSDMIGNVRSFQSNTSVYILLDQYNGSYDILSIICVRFIQYCYRLCLELFLEHGIYYEENRTALYATIVMDQWRHAYLFIILVYIYCSAIISYVSVCRYRI